MRKILFICFLLLAINAWPQITIKTNVFEETDVTVIYSATLDSLIYQDGNSVKVRSGFWLVSDSSKTIYAISMIDTIYQRMVVSGNGYDGTVFKISNDADGIPDSVAVVIDGVGNVNLPRLTASKLVTTDGSKNLQSTDMSNLTATSPVSVSNSPQIIGSSAADISIANGAADGATKGAAAFTANDFDAATGIISLDYTNGQAAATGVKGFLTGTDWDTFNNKQNGDATLTALAGLTTAANEIIYATGVDGFSMLAVNGTATNKFLRQISGGAPSWETLDAGDIPDLSTTYQPLHASLTSISGLTETNGGIPYGTADNAYAWLAAGTAGYLLQGNGVGTPSFTQALSDGITATTQSADDKSTKIATTAYADRAALKPIQFAVIDPDDFLAGSSDTLFIWTNYTGASVTVDSIIAHSELSAYDFSIIEWDEDMEGPSLVDALQCATAKGNWYRVKETTISGATIEAGHSIGFLSSSDDAEQCHGRIHIH